MFVDRARWNIKFTLFYLSFYLWGLCSNIEDQFLYNTTTALKRKEI